MGYTSVNFELSDETRIRVREEDRVMIADSPVTDQVFEHSGETLPGHLTPGFFLQASSLLLFVFKTFNSLPRDADLSTLGIRVERLPVDADRAKFFIKSRGIEPQRVHRLLRPENKLDYETPGLICEFLNPLAPNGVGHISVDGHHRYVARWQAGEKTMPWFIIAEPIWRKFIVRPNRFAKYFYSWVEPADR
jgi:hypothetical protein